MHTEAVLPHVAWQPIEKASFGLIYGAIMVLALVCGLAAEPEHPFEAAVLFFGSVLAVTFAKAFSELLSHAMETRERVVTPAAWQAAWSHSHPTLWVANVPTALFVAAGLGWIGSEMAVLLSQLFCVAILIVLGARVGWVVRHSAWLSLGGAAFAGGIGIGLAAMKYAIH